MIPSHEAIAQLAHELWEKAGRPENSAEKFWLEAEELLESRQLDQEHPHPAEKPKAKKAAPKKKG